MATQNFTINGMTCVGCQHKVKTLLGQIPGVITADVNLATKTATLESAYTITEEAVAQVLQAYPKYTIGAKILSIEHLQKKTVWQLYKPVFLIFIYLVLICSAIEIAAASFQLMRWMNHFMAGFFLLFSFFKMLDIKGFATSYAMYDVVAARWKVWGFLYPFVELGLGLLLLLSIQPIFTNWAVLLVMSISVIGVLQSVRNKRKIKCACLGAVFNLPMSTVTIIEDGLMILMSVYMLIKMYF
jgi:copper chaperone CopZ